MAGNTNAIQHLLIARLIKGIDNIQPKKPRYTHTWDVSVLLDYLKSPQLDLGNIKHLAKKTVTLLAITTAAHCSEITSRAVNAGVSIEQILKVGDWSNARTFNRFYNREADHDSEIIQANNTFARNVLDT